jgi:hypothetical protein
MMTGVDINIMLNPSSSTFHIDLELSLWVEGVPLPLRWPLGHCPALFKFSHADLQPTVVVCNYSNGVNA